jgi:cellulose synthase (UDP-forming)
MFFPALYLLFALSPIRADGVAWATHYLPFQAAVLLVTWLQSGGFKLSAIVASLLLLNSTAIVVGVLVMADPAPTWLSAGWAAMIVLILGRMIVESVTGGRIRRHETPSSAGPPLPLGGQPATRATPGTEPQLVPATA